MIINSMADAQVTDNDLVEFNFRPISYEIKSSTGTLSGEIGASSYLFIKPDDLGEAPYTVTLGYVNHSYQAAPVSVGDANAMCTFWMAFPAGPNGPKTFVTSRQK